jgi:hypothetical protein
MGSLFTSFILFGMGYCVYRYSGSIYRVFQGFVGKASCPDQGRVKEVSVGLYRLLGVLAMTAGLVSVLLSSWRLISG